MKDILTITLNPALDLSSQTGHVEAGPKLRCAHPDEDAGGGGINVARAVRTLGGNARAFVAAAGPSGTKVLNLLLAEGVNVVPFASPGETRVSLSIIDQTTTGQYRFVMPGPVWGASDCERARDAILSHAQTGGTVVFSGSLPRGLPVSFYSDLCPELLDKGCKVVMDTSGLALSHQAQNATAPASILRMDAHEAETLAKRDLPTREHSADFAAELIQCGAGQAVIIARGAEGSVLVDGEQRLFVTAADVPVRSKTGAGDSFVAGFTLALARGLDISTAMTHGAAAASAAVMTDATDLCDGDQAMALRAACQVSAL